jgi:hypothetical protein
MLWIDKVCTYELLMRCLQMLIELLYDVKYRLKTASVELCFVKRVVCEPVFLYLGQRTCFVNSFILSFPHLF